MRKHTGLPGVRTRVSQKAGRKRDLGSRQEGPRPGMAGDAWELHGNLGTRKAGDAGSR